MFKLEKVFYKNNQRNILDNLNCEIPPNKTTVIMGKNGSGKSTLLNALLNEQRAIVSDIAGTTRDTIEDELSIGGIAFRFIDTAGIRETQDTIEGLGIKKTFEKIDQAQVVVFLIDSSRLLSREVTVANLQIEIGKIKNKYPQKALIVVGNKADIITSKEKTHLKDSIESLQLIAAKTGQGVEDLKTSLLEFVNTGALKDNQTIVTNTRHYDALLKALEEITRVQEGINAGLSGDLMAIDIRQALCYFGEITGEITNDDLLGNIFANFCIGK